MPYHLAIWGLSTIFINIRVKPLIRPLSQHIVTESYYSIYEMNRGMSRKEMIVLIAELFGVSYKTAESHFDYLIKLKQFNELKCGGHVVVAQATTNNRTAITTQKLLRTHNTTLLAWSKQAEWNASIIGLASKMRARILVRTLSGRQRMKKSS